MGTAETSKVLFVTGIRVAIDEENHIFLAGMLSESPFIGEDEESSSTINPINFALTKQHAAFLKDRLDEFLKGTT